MDKYRVESIVHGEEGKVAIENMLKIMDEKALTPEGKINTTLERYSSSGKYEINSKAVSPKLSQEIRRGNN